MSKRFLYFAVFIVTGCNLPDREISFSRNRPLPVADITGKTGVDGPPKTDSLILLQKLKAISKKAKAENFDTHYALLADLGLHSGSKRLYVFDLKKQAVITSGLVTHGSSTTYLSDGKRKYSNEDGSLCSSLGIYKIGGSYLGKFGLAYKLYGLNEENSNAYDRAIVLHSHSCVPDKEIANSICQSWGCPTVSPAFLKTLSTFIDVAEKPILLYLFDSAL